MTASYTYDGSALSTVIRSTVSFTESADHGEVGSSTVELDDDAGTLAIVGHKSFIAEQSSCAVARTFSGYVGQRTYQRGERHMTGASREIALTLLDLNARLGFYVIRGRSWNRPKETISARMTALLASSFLSPLVADLGFVDYPTDELDKNDYRSQYPLDVIRDCALVVGFNYFVYYDPDVDDYGLWFQDSNSSTDWSSTLLISNDKADIDSSTTFAARQDTTLTRDPSQTYSGVLVPFAKGNVFESRAATAAAFEPRHAVAPNAQVKKRAKAITLAEHFLFERRNEEDIIHTTLRLKPASVNLIRAGQRVQARFTHYATEGYGEYSWFRVLERTVTQPLNTDADYDVALTLSPQEAGCSVQPTFVQTVYEDSTGSAPGALPRSEVFPFPATTPGNLVIVAIQSTPLNANTITQVPPGGWTWQVQNDVMPDGGDLVNIFWKKAEGESSMDVTFLGATIGHEVRFNMIEYAGLTNPALYGSVTEHSEAFPTPGFATSASTSYPAGPAAVVFVGSMQGGPQSSDVLSSDATLRTAIAGTLHGSNEIAFADDLLDTTAGSLTRHFYFTGLEALDTYGLVFTGDNC